MSHRSTLNRLLLAAYPKAYRAEHGNELLT